MIDRRHLAAWSLEVDDARFARALAALGAWRAAARRVPRAGHAGANESRSQQVAAISRLLAAARGEDDILAWQAPPIRTLAEVPDASLLADAWSAFLDETAWGLRIAVRSRSQQWSALLPMLQALQQPAVGAASVFVSDAFPADGRVDWRLPFRITVLPDDPLATAFAQFRAPWREPWPYRFRVAGRANPRLEILVFSTSLRQTAARLLRRRSPSRAALAIVLGGLDAGTDAVEALTRGIAHELSAEGVVCVSPSPDAGDDWPMRALVQFGDEMTHNRPLDGALTQAFGPNVIAFLGGDLLRLSRLLHAVDSLSSRLRALPRDAALAVSERSLDHLVAVPAMVGTPVTPPAPVIGGVGEGQRRGSAASAPPTARSVSPHLLARAIDDARDGYRFYRESDEASSLTEIATEVTKREAEQATAGPELRYIQHGFWRRQNGQLIQERQRLAVGTPIMLRVRIGPPDAQWQSAPQAFPAHELPRDRQRHRLQVVFHEPTQLESPLLGQLMLPRDGPSTVCELVFTPRMCADFEGRISVLHRGRVLQTVLIHTRVTEPDEAVDERETINQRVEARVRQHWNELGSRRRFDASFILNHSNQQRPLLTGIAGKRAWAKDLSGIDEPIASINRLLSNVAHSVADHSEGLTEGENLPLFIKLARLGADLYSSLVIDNLQPLQREGMDVEEETHIQIISTRADAVVPFEFIYQYQPPDDDGGVRFCPNALKALQDGACPQDCAGQKEARRHVCPMGFWGLRKVIERHVYNPEVEVPNQAEVIIQAEPAGDRVRLQLDRAALVAYSQEVKAAEVDPLLAALRQHLPEQVTVAANWDDWKQAIAGSHPSLLVAFPHNSGERQDIALEIGGIDFKTLRLPREYVHVDGAYPLMLLLGCDTASTAQQYANHIRYFRQAGAAAIVSTIATVFGPHAVKVGQKLLETLLAIHRQSTQDAQAGKQRQADEIPCLGEALREAKRQALLDSLPMALCVVAFGDADWRL